jgi:hypothetical protein
MNSITPSADRLACIGQDVALAAPEEKLQTFADRADTFGKLLRKGFFNAAALEQKLWDVARAYKLTGEPGSEAEEFITDVIEAAIAIDDEPPPVDDPNAFNQTIEPRAGNGHDADRARLNNTTALTKRPYKLMLARDITAEETLKSF